MAGLLKKRSRDKEAEIPTASMADIAFLLLIFFLVTTTINVDTGIGMTLPPPLDPEQEPPPVKERNLLKVLVNAEGRVLLEEEETNTGAIQQAVVDHVRNYGQDPNLAENPSKAVISIKTDAQTPYRTYIEVLDEVWLGYREVWDTVARTRKTPDGQQVLQRSYPSYQAYRNQLEEGEDNLIRDAIGANISIAEPDTGE
jgi:biopolymer transport protein ExbD